MCCSSCSTDIKDVIDVQQDGVSDLIRWSDRALNVNYCSSKPHCHSGDHIHSWHAVWLHVSWWNLRFSKQRGSDWCTSSYKAVNILLVIISYVTITGFVCMLLQTSDQVLNLIRLLWCHYESSLWPRSHVFSCHFANFWNIWFLDFLCTLCFLSSDRQWWHPGTWVRDEWGRHRHVCRRSLISALVCGVAVGADCSLFPSAFTVMRLLEWVCSVITHVITRCAVMMMENW